MSWNVSRQNRKFIIYILCLLLPLFCMPLAISPYKETRCSYVIIVVAVYWFLEPVPISVTGLLPVVLFPLLGILDSSVVSANYMKEIMFVIVGSMMVAYAVEECRLHERIALKVLLSVGTELHWLLLGIMLTTAFLSMWISNVATTAMMVPIVEAVVLSVQIPNKKNNSVFENKNATQLLNISLTETKQIENVHAFSKENTTRSHSTIRTALLLGICYAANIGGTGSLIGTAPNLFMKGLIEQLYPNCNEITYASWLMYNAPTALLCVLIGWGNLWIICLRKSKESIVSKEDVRIILEQKYSSLGNISAVEIQVVVLFLTLTLLWLFRDPQIFPGWAALVESDKKIGDSAAAILVGFLLLFVPSDVRDFKSRPVLEWKKFQKKFPWGILLLGGGGFSLAHGANKSGLTKLVGENLIVFRMLSPAVIVTVLCFLTAMLTEIMTNFTVALLFLPLFGQMATEMEINPIYLMLPLVVSCSFAFMLPVASISNAIVFEVGDMKTLDMVKPGIFMNIMCIAVQMLMINSIGTVIFDVHSFPSWANNTVMIDTVTPYNETLFNSTGKL